MQLTTTLNRLPRQLADSPIGIAYGLAALTHLLLLFGISFGSEQPRPRTLEVTLVSMTGSDPPWRARTLAELPQRGSGQGPRVRAQAALTSGVSSVAGLQHAAHLITSRAGAPGSEGSSTSTGGGAQVVSADASLWSFVSRQLRAGGDASKARQAQRQDAGSGLRTADYDQSAQAPGEADPSRPIAPQSVADPSAGYLDAWRRTVERVASENFPWAALAMGRSGRLTLEVALSADGAVTSTRVVRSSGLPMLDKAAVDILLSAAPYPVFPASMRRYTSELRFVHDWEFLADETGSVRVGGL